MPKATGTPFPPCAQPMPASAEAAGLDVTMTVPASAGPRTLGKVTVTNHAQHRVTIMVSGVTGATDAIAVADGHQISTSVMPGMGRHETIVEPQASVTFPASLAGYQCDQPSQAASSGELRWLPAGDYTFVPRLSTSPDGLLMGPPVTVHWTGVL